MDAVRSRSLFFVAAIVLVAGCTTPIQKSKSPLRPVQMSPDSSVFDVFFVRVPWGDPEVNEQLWQDVDEQQLPGDVRRRLAENGFRMGVIGGCVPDVLAKLLELGDKPVRRDATMQVDVGKLPEQPRVEARHMPLHAGAQGEIVTSETYDQLAVLLRGSGELCGQTYNQAQAVLKLTSTPQNDGRVKLELVPEVQHDQPKQRWVPDQGIFRLDAARPARTFADMAMTAALKPGDMLVLTSLPSRPGSLGHHFFSIRGEQPEQKLLVIRLSQTQHSDQFSPSEPLTLDGP